MTDTNAKRLAHDMPAIRAREVFDYSPETGVLSWRARPAKEFRAETHAVMWNAKHAGRAAGSPDKKGYLRVWVGGTRYRVHRIIWALVHGAPPYGEIDHINGNRADNRACNLRDIDRLPNMQNLRRPHRDNKIGLLGVALDRPGKFRAYIAVNGKDKHLGMFTTPEAAHAAYLAAKRELHEGNTL